jgi:predicted dehydrogenase
VPRVPGSTMPIGVAMLGAGYIAEYHLAGLAAAGGAEVRVIVGRTRDKAEALAKRFGVRDASVDIDAALARDDVQAVIVATPDDTHEAIAIAAARAGKAVLLQKPMAGSVAAAQRIVTAAATNRVDLQVSFMHRFFDEVVLARRWLDDGVLGRVLSARIRNATPGPDWGAWFFRKASVANGVVDQLGVHGIDLVEQLLGRVRSVCARARIANPQRRLRDGTLVQVETIDNASAIYELDEGVLVSHEMSMTEVAGCDRFRMEIYGDKGTLWLRTERGRLAAVVPDRFGSEWHVPELPHAPPGQRQHAVWIAGIAGNAPRLATASEAVRGMRIVEALMRSNQRGGQAVAVADAEAVTEDSGTPIPRGGTR